MQNRVMHLRHPQGFDQRRFEQFRAHCRVFKAFVEALLADWNEIGAGKYPAPRYEFGEPALSDDRTVASLPLGGEATVGSRAQIENASSFMLWRFFDASFREQMDEGITEDIGSGMTTNWRPVTVYFEVPQ